MAALTTEEIEQALEGLPGWRRNEREVFKNFKFETFMDAIAFINRVAAVAEDANHHPDLENHYNRVRVALHTWSENAITEKDVSLARQIERVGRSL